MKTIPVLLCLLCAVTLGAKELKLGDQWPELRSTNGKVFKEVKFTFVSPREVRFMHSDGSTSMLLSELAVSEDVTVSTAAPSTTMGPLGAMMSPEERKLSGVDKLSNREQAILAAWVKKAVDDRLQEEHEKADPRKLTAGSGTFAETVVVTMPVASSPPATMLLPEGVTPPAEPTTITIKATLPPPPPVEELPPEEAPGLMLTPLTPPRSSPALLPPPVEPGDLARQRVAARMGVVETWIDGEFQGLGTGRKFQLANGQVWRQHEAYGQEHSAFEPSVMIYPVDGGWMMKVDGVAKPVRVIPYLRDAMAEPAGLVRR